MKKNEISMHAIGKRMYEVRKKTGLTQERVEEMADLPAKTLSKYECGVAEPGVTRFLQIALALGVTLDQLVPVEARISSDTMRSEKNELITELRAVLEQYDK